MEAAGGDQLLHQGVQGGRGGLVGGRPLRRGVLPVHQLEVSAAKLVVRHQEDK